MDEFPLGWRFTAVRLGTDAAQFLSRVRPLTADAAARVAQSSATLASGSDTPSQFIRSDDPPGTVRRHLAALGIDPATDVMLSWNPATALSTDWMTFVAHWDDFCYPASDDVVIRPVDDGWTLRYHHYEVFQFSRG